MRKLACPIALVGIVVAACGDDSRPGVATAFPECTNEECARSEKVLGGIVIENRTAAPIELGTRSAAGMRIDRRIVDGVLRLPIPAVTGSTERRFLLGAQEKTALDDQIIVVERGTPVARFGSFIRIAGGPSFLALGTGTVFVRTSMDGTPFFEEEDPKTLTLARDDRVVAECEGGPVSPPFEPPSKALFASVGEQHGPVRVRSVVRDVDGCRTIEVGDDRPEPVATLRACIPDEAYPFTDGETVHVSTSGGPQITAFTHFVGAGGSELRFGRIAFEARTSSELDGLELAFDEQDTCRHVDPLCGHVDVPVRLTGRTRDGTVHPVAHGVPIHEVGDKTTFYVFASTARPVADTKCPHAITDADGDAGAADDPTALTALARAWVAVVTRP
jgi:hypothetical protein